MYTSGILTLQTINILNITVTSGSFFKPTNSYNFVSKTSFSNGYIEDTTFLSNSVFILSDISYFTFSLFKFENCSSSG